MSKVAASKEEPKTIESEVELAKRAFALRKFEESVEHYATALELMTAKLGDGAPESADLLFMYGKALLENAITQADVIKKEEAEGGMKGETKDAAGPSGSKGKGPIIEFGGDAEEEDEEEDEPVDLLLANPSTEEDEEEGEGQAGGDGEEPEDDFNAAWEVLDLARALYAKAEGDEAKLKLADTYMALGDVSLETEKFDQAVNDYTSGLSLKQKTLPLHSRQIAEAHYRLSLALDLTPGKLSQAVEQAEKAVASVDARLELLHKALDKATDSDAAMADSTSVAHPSGALIGSLANDGIDGLSKTQLQAQLKEFEEMRAELAAKVEDLKTVPEQPVNPEGEIESATDAANRALDEALNPGYSLSGPPRQINDLSSMVKKKKKPVAPAQPEVEGSRASGKRKADDEIEMDGTTTPPEKKRMRDEDAMSESAD